MTESRVKNTEKECFYSGDNALIMEYDTFVKKTSYAFRLNTLPAVYMAYNCDTFINVMISVNLGYFVVNVIYDVGSYGSQTECLIVPFAFQFPGGSTLCLYSSCYRRTAE